MHLISTLIYFLELLFFENFYTEHEYYAVKKRHHFYWIKINFSEFLHHK